MADRITPPEEFSVEEPFDVSDWRGRPVPQYADEPAADEPAEKQPDDER